jgi:hypothetical protein
MNEEIILLIGIISLIISIVILIKFFQIASNVKDLKEKSWFEMDSFDFLIANNYNEEAKRKLLRQVWNDQLMNPLKNKPTKETFDLHYPRLKEKYNEKFIRLGEDFPKYDKLIHK